MARRRILRDLRRRGIGFTIPRLSKELRRDPFIREIYRQRNIVESAINRLKQWRRIATRYEKLAGNYTAMITLAFVCCGYSLKTRPRVLEFTKNHFSGVTDGIN
ncbi:transposase [Microcoleus sp. D2_18a_B4]|uniref:transposase n=1 Tax=Microcoleus sp. D2_18a_B4 TaxID=3055329 RepID=UPI004040C647